MIEKLKSVSIKPYLVVTSNGFWGKGETPVEAAKNAFVDGQYVHGTLYHAHQSVVDGEMDCSCTGQAELKWQNSYDQLIYDNPKLPLEDILWDSLTIASGKLKVTKGKLVIQSEWA